MNLFWQNPKFQLTRIQLTSLWQMLSVLEGSLPMWIVDSSRLVQAVVWPSDPFDFAIFTIGLVWWFFLSCYLRHLVQLCTDDHVITTQPSGKKSGRLASYKNK